MAHTVGVRQTLTLLPRVACRSAPAHAPALLAAHLGNTTTTTTTATLKESTGQRPQKMAALTVVPSAPGTRAAGFWQRGQVKPHAMGSALGSRSVPRRVGAPCLVAHTGPHRTVAAGAASGPWRMPENAGSAVFEGATRVRSVLLSSGVASPCMSCSVCSLQPACG